MSNNNKLNNAAVKVVVYKADAPNSMKTYNSMAQAEQALKKAGIAISIDMIKRRVKAGGGDALGYKIMSENQFEEFKKNNKLTITPQPHSPLEYVFGNDFDELFRGKRVRMTHTTPKYISVYDIIRAICDTDRPMYTYNKVCVDAPEVAKSFYNFTLDGQGARETPCCDVQTLVELIQVLPGTHAAKFRSGGAKILIRFMGGDESLIQEVKAIANHHASGSSQGTIGQLRHEAVQDQQQRTPQVVTTIPDVANTHKYALLSPSLYGRSIDEFFNARGIAPLRTPLLVHCV